MEVVKNNLNVVELDAQSTDHRVLVFAPLGRDALVTAEILQEEGLGVETCSDAEELCSKINEGASVALISQESLNFSSLRALNKILSEQPKWSDFPLIILVNQGKMADMSRQIFSELDAIAQATFLERPIRKLTLVSTVRTALRARKRQYQLRDYLIDRKTQEQALRQHQALLRNVLELMPVGISIVDVKGNPWMVNPVMKRLWGNPPIDSRKRWGKSKAWWVETNKLVSEDEWPIAYVLKHGLAKLNQEIIIESYDHVFRTILNSAVPITDSTGGVIGAISVSQDISERKRSERHAKFLATLGSHILSIADPKDVINLVVRLVVEHFSAARCFLEQIDQNNNSITVYGDYGPNLPPIQGVYNFSVLREDVIAQLKIGMPVAISDNTDARFVNTDQAVLQSQFYLPLLKNWTWIGTLVIATKDIRYWYPEDVNLLRSVVDLIWLAIEKGKLFQNLKDSEDRLKQALSAGSMLAWEWDPLSDISKHSGNAMAVIGGTFKDRKTYTDLFIHPEDRERIRAIVNAALAHQNFFIAEYRIVRPDTQAIRWIESRANIIRNGDSVTKVEGMLIDITARKHAEEQLLLHQEHLEELVAQRTVELRELASHLQSVREEEKTSIAREIHDELGGLLTALKIDMSWLQNKLPNEQSIVLEKINIMSHIIDSAVRALRKIQTDLRPTILDNLGLIAAIEWQSNIFSMRTGIECDVHFNTRNFTFTDSQSITLFRIFQESLTNISKHAEASKVNIHLYIENNQVYLIIKDNGKGIAKKDFLKPSRYGIKGIFERARALEGDAKVDGGSQGTSITVIIPLGSSKLDKRPFNENPISV